jgi:hypothetical protein
MLGSLRGDYALALHRKSPIKTVVRARGALGLKRRLSNALR